MQLSVPRLQPYQSSTRRRENIMGDANVSFERLRLRMRWHPPAGQHESPERLRVAVVSACGPKCVPRAVAVVVARGPTCINMCTPSGCGWGCGCPRANMCSPSGCDCGRRLLASRLLASRPLASRLLASRPLTSRLLASRPPASSGSQVVGSRVVGSWVVGSRVVGSRVVGSRVVGSRVSRWGGDRHDRHPCL